MMKKIMPLIISVSLVMVLLSGCMLLKNEQAKTPSENKLTALGLRTMPSDFLNWWFDQLKSKQASETFAQSKKPLKVIATYNEIINTQYILDKPVNTNVPPSYDLRDYNDVPSVGNQGNVSDCWAYSTVESLESAMLVQLGPFGISANYPFISNPSGPQLSVQFVAYNNYNWNIFHYFLIYQETNQDNGGNHFFSFYNLCVRGVPLASDFPYNENLDNPYIAWNPTNPYWPQDLVKAQYAYVIPSAEWFYSHGYSYTDYIETIKSAIMTYGAVAVDFRVYSDFEEDYSEPSGWVYPGPSNTATENGGHAVILIGWDDDWTYNGTDYGPVWILQNSWGTNWGHDGYWRQPMISESQYDNPQTIGNWQIESNPGGMYVPAL